MRKIAPEQLQERIRSENPWWRGEGIDHELDILTPRAYFDLFFPLITDLSVRRAVVLMGPRRVGKTVLIHHAIKALLNQGVAPQQIAYVSVDHPLYNDFGLDALVDLYRASSEVDATKPPTCSSTKCSISKSGRSISSPS